MNNLVSLVAASLPLIAILALNLGILTTAASSLFAIGLALAQVMNGALSPFRAKQPRAAFMIPFYAYPAVSAVLVFFGSRHMLLVLDPSFGWIFSSVMILLCVGTLKLGHIIYSPFWARPKASDWSHP